MTSMDFMPFRNKPVGVRCQLNRWHRMRLGRVVLASCLFAGVGVGSVEAGRTDQAGAPRQVLEQAQQLEAAKHYAEAVAAYRTYLRLHPDNDEVRAVVAKLLAWQGHYDEAAAWYQDVLSRHPLDHDSRVGLARVLAWQKRWSVAQAQYERVLRDAPEHTEAWIGLGDVHRWSGRLEPAVRAYERALGAADTPEVAARLREAQAELAAATAPLRSAVPESMGVDRLIQEGRQREAEQAYEAAAARYRDALTVDPVNDDLRVMLARVLSWQGSLDEAARLYGDVLGRHPGDQETRVALARVRSWQKRFDEARQLYDEVVHVDPAHLDARRGLAEVAHWQGNRGEALARYQALADATHEPEFGRRVEAVRSELLVSPQAAVGQGLTGLRLPYRDYAKIGYGHYSYTKGIANERDLLFELAKPIGDQTLVLRVEPIHRFGQHDTPVSAEYYSPLWERAWGYVAAQGTVNPHFAPNYSVVGDVHQGLGGLHAALAPVEVSCGYRRLNYKRDSIDLWLPAVTVFLPFNLWVTEKVYYVPDTGATTLASQLTWRPADRVQVFASGSFGTSGERIVATQDVTRISSRTFQGGTILPVTQRISAEATGFYEDRSTLYVRRGGSLNLLYHW